MKKAILFFGFALSALVLSAQCSDLFFSEYVEGYSNNKAVEIYNPTGSAINLSGYSIARFSNGSTNAGANKVIQLPDVMLQPNDVYVVIVDLTDMSQWDSQFDKPVWNGYNVIDTLFDNVTGDPLVDDDGNIIFGPQYNDNGSALFGSDYNEEYDLQCKADVFLCPEYEINNAMYFNGNDAVALISGTEVDPSGNNLVDVIGVIGEDPEDNGEDAWVDADGYWLTKDRTLVRKPDVATGRNAHEDVVFQQGGTFIGTEWLSYPKNSFQYLQTHNSVCNTETQADEFSCSEGPILGTYQINEIPFSVFPNPAKSSVTIEADEDIQTVSLFNLMGQQLYSRDLGNATHQANLELDHFATGMYLIHLSFDKNKISIQKLIVE